MSKNNTYEIVTLDVWGHGSQCEEYDCDGNCEGYWVNDVFKTGRKIEISDDATDDQIVKALVDAGELKPVCLNPGSIEVEGDNDYMILVDDGETGEPILQLHRV